MSVGGGSLGVVAAGSPWTVEAGLRALRRGGNAVDAAVSASLMAGVAEPLLTGLGGGGVATVRVRGEVEVCDMFGAVPGAGSPAGDPPPMEELVVDFGATRQTFQVGPASVAVPGMPAGLWALHQRHGRLPMAELAAFPAEVADKGVPVTPIFHQILGMLWGVQRRDLASRALFSTDGQNMLRVGDTFRNPDLARTLRRYGQDGPEAITQGDVAEAILATLGRTGRLTRADLAHTSARFSAPVRYAYRDAMVHLPGPPSIAGLLVAQALRALEDHGPMPDLLSVRQLCFLAHALDRADQTRKGRLRHHLFHPAFVSGFLQALAPEEQGEEAAHRGGRGPRMPGNTTHISVVDANGDAVAITHSLGETAGRLVPGTGLLLNNFLGEPDVNPPDVGLPVGSRLMTMCCPTLIEVGGAVHALGSAGSSRIRSAILHGIVLLTDFGLPADEVVNTPRCHVEDGTLFLEAEGTPPRVVEAMNTLQWRLRTFDSFNLFFGGLNVATGEGRSFSGGGDPRRSGAVGVA
ncbi:MAG: gamma-glutamyltransferase [Deltaproteobacteria bacterium]|nr:gamma-glutamyltransferase [Deltaproteobacteria bacterium]